MPAEIENVHLLNERESARNALSDEEIRLLVRDAAVALDSNSFLREVIHDLGRTVSDFMGPETAAACVSAIGARLGEVIDHDYRKALRIRNFDWRHLAAVLEDLKRRIEGGFSIVSADPDKIVLVNDSCPFGREVIGQPAMCMMTSSVFGRVAANNSGYAKVELAETIADGDKRCRIVVHLSLTDEAAKAEGREYFTLIEDD